MAVLGVANPRLRVMLLLVALAAVSTACGTARLPDNASVGTRIEPSAQLTIDDDGCALVAAHGSVAELYASCEQPSSNPIVMWSDQRGPSAITLIRLPERATVNAVRSATASQHVESQGWLLLESTDSVEVVLEQDERFFRCPILDVVVLCRSFEPSVPIGTYTATLTLDRALQPAEQHILEGQLGGSLNGRLGTGKVTVDGSTVLVELSQVSEADASSALASSIQEMSDLGLPFSVNVIESDESFSE